MKKLLVSLGVVFGFTIYSLSQQKPAGEVVGLALDNQTAGPTQTPLPSATIPSGKYRDGEYTGNTADAFYGNVQVKAVIQNGRLADVQFLQYPNDRDRSLMISRMALPMLKSEAIAAQSGQVDMVSGATDTSMAFVQSLGSALTNAKI